MKILVISAFYPMPDRASGDLRFYNLLNFLCERHDVFFYSYDVKRHCQELGITECNRYQQLAQDLGLRLFEGPLPRLLQKERFDVVFFEFYHSAPQFRLDLIRFWQPHAKVVIDSVDIHFHRLRMKAQVTQKQTDISQAADVQARELSAYNQADIILTVTEKDKDIVLSKLSNACVKVLPNIHYIHPFKEKSIDKSRVRLLFVGGFKHEPNIDAVLYFCRKIFPKIVNKQPNVHLIVIGSNPPEEIRRLASNNVEVLGFVPELYPYYEKSDIAIAPLRFGGGMKGKVGEAMSFGLPVVTTSFGAEGFGFTPGEHVLIGDNADDFASKVLMLLHDQQLYEYVRKKGWEFIKSNYSTEAVKQRTFNIFESIEGCKVKRLPLMKRSKMWCESFLERHLLWRLKIT